jgi:hypothetical protein
VSGGLPLGRLSLIDVGGAGLLVMNFSSADLFVPFDVVTARDEAANWGSLGSLFRISCGSPFIPDRHDPRLELIELQFARLGHAIKRHRPMALRFKGLAIDLGQRPMALGSMAEISGTRHETALSLCTLVTNLIAPPTEAASPEPRPEAVPAI